MQIVEDISAPPTQAELRLDGWVSQLSGMGILGKDKNESSFFARQRRLPQDTLDAMYRHDALAARIVDTIVDDAMRKGFRIVFKGDDENPIDPKDVNEINSKVNKWAQSVQLHPNVKKHVKQARAFGGSLLVMGAEDGQDPAEPLNPDAISDFTFIKPLDRFQVSSSGMLNTDARSHAFGLPNWYHLHSVVGTAGARGNSLMDQELQRRAGIVGGSSVGTFAHEENVPTLSNVTVHTSRVVRTDGISLSDRSRLNNDGWGDAVLERVHDPLRNWNTVMNATGSLVVDMNGMVYGIKGLAQLVAANKGNELQKRFQMMDLAASNWNAKVLDADGETATRLATNLTGLGEVIDRIGMHLGAAAAMPLTLILEVSPGGFGTGANENNQWDDVVAAYQVEVLEPIFEQVFKVLFSSKEFSSVPENWSIEFNPLSQMTELEQADLHLKQAQADQIYIGITVLTPNEVAESRFGGESYSVNTQLDEEAREGMAEGKELTEEEKALEAEAGEQNSLVEKTGKETAQSDVPEGEEEPTLPEGAEVAGATLDLPAGEVEVGPAEAADPGTAFNGAQVQALSGIIGQVVNGEIPFASAVQLVAIAFPVDEAAANRLLMPAQAMATTVAAEKAATKAAMPDAMKGQMDAPAPGQPGGPPAGNAPEGEDAAAPGEVPPAGEEDPKA